MDDVFNSDPFGWAMWQRDPRPRHRIGGYGHPVHGPVEVEAAMAALGSDDEDPAVWEEAHHWTLLAQIDSDEDAGMTWSADGAVAEGLRGGGPARPTIMPTLTRCGEGRNRSTRVVPDYQLKIALNRIRPPVWRRVRVPATTTLADLHQVIGVLFDWDDDHLHVFTADGRRYADPFFELDDCADEARVRLGKVLPRAGGSMRYVYDLGDWWEHKITLERVIESGATTRTASCVGGQGDAPVGRAKPKRSGDAGTGSSGTVWSGSAAGRYGSGAGSCVPNRHLLGAHMKATLYA